MLPYYAMFPCYAMLPYYAMLPCYGNELCLTLHSMIAYALFYVICHALDLCLIAFSFLDNNCLELGMLWPFMIMRMFALRSVIMLDC